MKLLLSIMIVAGLYLPLSSFANDLEAGKSLAQKSCAVCHGLDGQATVPLAAHISGQQKDYLIIQLRAYKSGKRQHQQMSIIAKPLTNQQIDQLAEWYSNIKVSIEAPEQTDTKDESNTSSDGTLIEEASETESKQEKEQERETTSKNNATQDAEDKSNNFDSEIIQSIQDSMQKFIK